MKQELQMALETLADQPNNTKRQAAAIQKFETARDRQDTNQATVALYRAYGDPKSYPPAVRDALSLLLNTSGEEFLYYLENENQLPPPEKVAPLWDTFTEQQQMEYLISQDTGASQYRRMVSGKIVTGWEAYIGSIKITYEGYCAFATKSEALHAAEQFQQEQVNKLNQLVTF